MKYIKLYETFSDYKIIKLNDLKDHRIYNTVDPCPPDYISRSHFRRSKFTKLDNLIELLGRSGLTYEFVEKEKYKEGVVVHFTTPKRFDKFAASMHEYSPADLYYTIRLSEYDDEWFLFQWFGTCYATKEHVENYYKKYPHFGPGGSRHTYIDNNGDERLCYQPPIYAGYKDHVVIGDNFGSLDRSNFYLCDQWHSLVHLLNDFIDFLKKPNVARFEANI